MNLNLNIEDEKNVDTIVRDIFLSDLPFESLSLGYFELRGRVVDSIALLVSTSSFLKNLDLHDILSD